MIQTIKNFFTVSTVRAEIMKVLNQRISLAEADFKSGVVQIKNQLEQNIQDAVKKSKIDTSNLLKELVKKVVNDLVK